MDKDENRVVEQLTFIEDANLSNQQALIKFLKLLQDPEGEVRMRVLEKIGLAEKKEYIDHVISALEDDDELVRTTALEIIGDWGVKSEYDRVVDALNDQDFIVRYAAIDALGDLGEERAIPTLMSLLPQSSDREKVSCYAALAKLDTKKSSEWSQCLLDLITSSDYGTRCAVANITAELWPEDDLLQLVSRLKQALADEDTVAARSTIETALREIDELMQQQ